MHAHCTFNDRPTRHFLLYICDTIGSAPLAPHVLQFMRILCACPIHEGYGQTETTAMTSLTFPGDWTTGHVGGCVPACEVSPSLRLWLQCPLTRQLLCHLTCSVPSVIVWVDPFGGRPGDGLSSYRSATWQSDGGWWRWSGSEAVTLCGKRRNLRSWTTYI